MVNTLDLDLRPGSGIGPFELGASLFDVLAFLRQPSPPTFPSVSVNFDTSKPVVSPIILHLRPHLHLRFTPLTQRLHTISLSLRRDPTAHPPLVLSYKNEVLSGPDVVLRRTAVQRMMGPTYKGDSMSYPGVWFSFEEDTHGMPTNNGANVAEGNTEVKRVVVTQRSEQSEHEQKEDADELAPNSVMYGDIKKAIIKLHDGIYLHFYTPESDMPPIHVRLGITTAEDLTCDLGPPVLTHYKEDDRMAIHATAQDDEESYFYNYFQHGLDFLISGKTHRVRKIIVHTNVPGSPLFQRYKRCPWEIELNPSDTNLLVPTPEATPSSSPAPESNVPATKQTGKKKKKKHDVEQVQATRASFEVRDDAPSRTNNNTVTFDEAIDTLRAQLNPSGTKHSAQPSMQLERTADLPHHELITLPNATTQLLAFDGVVCEASEMGDLLSLVLF